MIHQLSKTIIAIILDSTMGFFRGILRFEDPSYFVANLCRGRVGFTQSSINRVLQHLIEFFGIG